MFQSRLTEPDFGVQSKLNVTSGECYQWRIFEIFELLRRNPEIGVIHPEYGEGVRTFPVERHIVIYDAYWPSVTILAILPPHADFRNEVVLEM